MRFPKTLAVLLLIVSVCAVLLAAALMASYALPVQDFAQYWAAAHLFSQNPYSMQPTREFERAAGIFSTPLVTKTPPWAIVLLLPLGVFGYHLGFAIWTLMSVIIVAGSARIAWERSGSESSLTPAILSLVFGPTIVLLMLGQFTVLVLLGVILFCVLVSRKRDWPAGASLLLVLGKPHVALLFLVAVALWSFSYRRWVVAVSGALSLATASIAALAINPRVFVQFWGRTMLVVRETESYPNLGGMFYQVSGLHSLALLPQLAGLIWLLFYWWKHRMHWDWQQHGLIVLLVSVACSYYSYPYDEILALPALVTAFVKGDRRIFLVGFALTNLGYVFYISGIAGHFGYGYMFLWWTATGWLATCLLARKGAGEKPALSS
jgi:Glycosyltransferase family 87